MTPPPPRIRSPIQGATGSGASRRLASPSPRAAACPTLSPGLTPLQRLSRRDRHLGPAVADVDVPEPAQAVEVFLAADVADRGAAPADVDHGLGVVDRVM